MRPIELNKLKNVWDICVSVLTLLIDEFMYLFHAGTKHCQTNSNYNTIQCKDI
jgi:hypothetical protein